MKTIVLTGGGTAGHCTPHFALLKNLKKHFDEIYYIGSINGIEKRLAQEQNIPYYEIPTVKLKRSFSISNLKIPFSLINSVSSAKRVLKELNPTIVFSKGGFVGLPVTIACNKLNIPVIIHESDLSLGLANKIASRFADKTLTSFENTAKTIKNGLYVGSPIREELYQGDRNKSLKKYGFSSKKPTLLITGGSSGAKAINQMVIDSVDELTKKYNVLHIVGKGNLSNVFIKGYYQTEFTDMKDAYSVTDICVSRAGSNTIFELATLKIPTLLIPLPKLESRGDQIENAKYFAQKGLCRYILQEDLKEGDFVRQVDLLYQNKEDLKQNLIKANITPANDEITKILTKY